MGKKTEISNLLAKLPRLGVGLSYRSRFFRDVLQNQQSLDFLEIVADDYLFAPIDKLKELERLTQHFTVIPHALRLSLGTAEGVDEAYLDEVAALVRRLRPPWWSEYIGYTRSGGINIGQPAPLPFNRQAIDAVARNMITVRRRIAAPLILENVDYTLDVPGGDMSEPDFVNEVLAWGGCGMLLDVSSFCSHATRRGEDPLEAASRLPKDRIVQLQFDTSREPRSTKEKPPPPNEVWGVLESIVKEAPVRGVVIEQNDKFASFEKLVDQINNVRELGRRHNRWN
mgnify:CR=1 FL=1